MKSYRCPTCGKTLSRSEYERALRIHEERARHFAQREAQVREKERNLKAKQVQWQREQRVKERETRMESQRKLKAEKNKVRQQEKVKAARQQAGLIEQLQQAKEKLRQRERGTTPQTEGLEFEEKLVTRLHKEFPNDQITHKGKSGDVLHEVMFNKKIAGTIIYECKRTTDIKGAHILQTHRARQEREADFGVLVTTGKKKGFNGFKHMDGVLIASPLAVLSVAALLRENLIEMARLKITKEGRAKAAQRLAEYIDSPQFKNPIEDMVHRTTKLQRMIKKEAREHLRIWRERWDHYDMISWDTAQVNSDVRLVLHGEQPRQIAGHKTSFPQLLEQKKI